MLSLLAAFTLSSFLFETPIGQWALALVIVGAGALVVRVLAKVATLAHNAADRAAAEHRSTVQIMLLRAGDALARCASDAVSYVEMTLRPQVLGAAKDGKLNADQAKALKDAAVKLAMEQARVQFGKALEQLGVGSLEAFAPTIEHLVEGAAQKIAGNSRVLGLAAVPVEAPKPTDPQTPSA